MKLFGLWWFPTTGTVSSLRGKPVATINEFLQRTIEEGEELMMQCGVKLKAEKEETDKIKEHVRALRMKTGSYINSLNGQKNLEERLREQLEELHEGGADHYCTEQHKVLDKVLRGIQDDLVEVQKFANTTKCDGKSAFVQCTALENFRKTKQHRHLLHHILTANSGGHGTASFLALQQAGFIKSSDEAEEESDDTTGDRLVQMYRKQFYVTHDPKQLLLQFPAKHLTTKGHSHDGTKVTLTHHQKVHKHMQKKKKIVRRRTRKQKLHRRQKHRHAQSGKHRKKHARTSSHPSSFLQEKVIHRHQNDNTDAGNSTVTVPGARILTRVLWNDAAGGNTTQSDSSTTEAETSETDTKNTTDTTETTKIATEPIFNQTAPINVTAQHFGRNDRCAVHGQSCDSLKDGLMSVVGEIADEADYLQAQIHQLADECGRMIAHHHQNIQYMVRQHDALDRQISTLMKKKIVNEENLRQIEKELELREHGRISLKNNCDVDEAANIEQQCGFRDSRQFTLKDTFARDCALSEWIEWECNRGCGTTDGKKKYTRHIITQPNEHGVACGQLVKFLSCGRESCPKDCMMSDWEGWSACTAKCNGGVRMRTRMIQQNGDVGGIPCEEDMQSEMCNLETCDDNCIMDMWDAWSGCTRACNGFRRRTREKKSGLCGETNVETEQWGSCNNDPSCVIPEGACQSKLDVVFLLDSSGSINDDDWKLGTDFINKLSARIASVNATGTMVSFGGPSIVAELLQCDSGKTEFCGITALSETLSELKDFKPERPKGTSGTNLPGALVEADHILSTNARSDAEAITFVLTDGPPNSKFNTKAAAARLREHSRLYFLIAGLEADKDFPTWASHPVQQNLRFVPTFTHLQNIINDVAADLCPLFEKK